MAKLADALGLGSNFYKMWVQVPPSINSAYLVEMVDTGDLKSPPMLGIGSSPIMSSVRAGV